MGTLPASLPVDGCAVPGAPTQERGSHQSSVPCRSFPCSRVGTLPACSLSLVAQCLGLPRRSVGAIKHPHHADRSHAPAWERCPRRSLSLVAQCLGLPRRSVGAINHPHHADRSHAPAWERCPRRSLSLVAQCLGLPRRSVGAINHPHHADRSHAPAWERHSRAPCRWLRSAWGSRATGRNVPDRPERTFRVHLRS